MVALRQQVALIEVRRLLQRLNVALLDGRLKVVDVASEGRPISPPQVPGLDREETIRLGERPAEVMDFAPQVGQGLAIT